jgi:hypothetical protein
MEWRFVSNAENQGRICDSVHRQQRTRSLSRLQAAFRLKPVQQTAVAPNRRCARKPEQLPFFVFSPGESG